jgi:membrane-associated phospholipid phosphatase
VIRSRFHPARDVTLALGAVLLFAWLAHLTLGAVAPGFDMAVRAAVHTHASPWLTGVMKAASQAGSGWVLFPGGVIIVACLVRAARTWEAVLFAIAVAGANLMDEALKLFFHRARPEAWFNYPLPITYSFPSGHAFVSSCFYLCLAELLIRDGWPVARKVAMWSAAVACTLTIGISRVYLGVHYPTDVLAGYVAATAWTTMIRVAHHVRQRRANGRGEENLFLEKASGSQGESEKL